MSEEGIICFISYMFLITEVTKEPIHLSAHTKKLLLAHHLSHSRALFTPIALKQERFMLAPLPSIPDCSS